MANTLLACPHCNSALTFAGVQIPIGTPVECMICGQTFPVQPLAARAEKAKPAATPVPAKAKPAPPPVPTASKAKPDQTAPRRPDQPRSSARLGLIAIAFGLLLLTTLGGGYGIWKIVTPAPPILNSLKQIDINDNIGDPPQPDLVTKAPDTNKVELPSVGPDDDDEIRRKKEAEKKLLVRKDPIKPIGSDIAFDPISAINVPNQSAAGLDQKKINAAIDKGLIYLRKSQNENGTWHAGHELGYAAIGGLTLLECGVLANDPAVIKAAAHVRANAPDNDTTYEQSLAVLFLDRLGDARDRTLIQWLSLRILAGQNESGGWTYGCPQHPPLELFKLYAFLRSHQRAGKDPIEASRAPPKGTPHRLNMSEQYQMFHNLMLTQGKAKAPPPMHPSVMIPEMRSLPVVQNQGKKKGQQKLVEGQGDDNSNTQFALLALWAARRHGIPTDAALTQSYLRFQASQSPDGGWGYTPQTGSSTHAMTCVGLLGAAMGHGADMIESNPKDPKAPIVRPVLEDPVIKKGLAKLAEHIGDASKDSKKTDFPMENLYFLWSVERVALLYDLKTINGKDWYGWGAQILIHNQTPDGEWAFSDFSGQSGPINTCFALLFLKRSNLVQDLTNHLRLHSAIRDPG